MKFNNINAFLALSLLLLAFAGCNDVNKTNQGNIPVDDKKVNEHIIPIREAIEYTSRFRQSRARMDSFFRVRSTIGLNQAGRDTSTQQAGQGPLTIRNAEYFNRDAIAVLLNQAGPDGGVRIYYGQDKNGVVKLVLVPVKNREDVITRLVAKNGITIPGIQSANAAPFDGEQAIERGQECPQMCPLNSPLNEEIIEEPR